MADLSLSTVLGLKIETTSGTFTAPSSSTDLVTVADLKPTIDGLTVDIKEFTGSVNRPGPIVLGKTFSVSGRLLLRGPGGSSPPTADGWNPGRILRAAGLAEVVVSTAVPVSPEAVGPGGSTTTVELGATASATADLYRGKLISLSLLGSGKPGLTGVRTNSTAKIAALMETATAPQTSGNWQLIKQLAYILSSAAAPTLSVSCWVGSRRIDARGCAISAFKIVMPTSSRDGQDVPSIEFTLTGDVQAIADDTAPQAPANLAVPPFRDGKMWVANTQLGGSSLTIDFGATIGYPPNPNKPTGNDAAQVTETKRTVNLTLNQVALATFNDVGLADAQSYNSIFALWGLAVGNNFAVMVTDARFNYRSPDNSGAFVTSTGDAYVDGGDKTIALVIGYPPSF